MLALCRDGIIESFAEHLDGQIPCPRLDETNNQEMGWLCLGVASVAVPRSWQEKSTLPGGRGPPPCAVGDPPWSAGGYGGWKQIPLSGSPRALSDPVGAPLCGYSC